MPNTEPRVRAFAASLLAALALGCAGAAPRAAAPASEAPAGRPAAQSESAPAAPTGPPRTLTLGLANKTFTQVPQWAAETQGYFAAEGLSVEPTYTAASTTVIAA